MEKQKVKNLFKFLPKSKHKAGEGLENGEYPFYTSSAVVNKYLDEYDYDAGKLIFATGGSASVHYANSKFAVSTDNFILEPNEDVNAKYVYYYLKNNIQILQDGFHGAGLQHLSKDYLNEINIPILDSDSQEKIVSILDKADEIRQKKKLANDKLDEFLESTFINMFGDPIVNNKNWNTDIINNVAPIKSFNGNVDVVNGQYWLLNLDVIESNTGNILAMNYELDIPNSTCSFNDEMVLYSKLRPYLNKVVIPKMSGYATSELLPLNPKKDVLNKYFLAYLLRSESFVNDINIRVAGAKMPRVSMDYFRNFEVILPPIELQNKFASIVEHIEQQKEKNQRVIEQMDNLFNSLSQKAFKGEL